MRKLPISDKNLRRGIVVLTGVVAVLIVLFVHQVGKRAENKAGQSATPVTVLDASLFDVDSDQDGLPDWEESLWGTDKDKADTDDDGMNDPEEIAAKRDPRVPGPNDPLTEQATPIYARADEKLNTTEKFNKEYIEGLLELKDQNIINSTSINNLGASLSSKYIYREGKLSTKYKEEDLATVPPTEANLRAFATTMGDLVEKYSTLGNKDDFKVLQIVLMTNSNEYDAKLFAISDSYRRALVDLAAVKVPTTYTDLYTNLLNSVETIKNIYSVTRDELVSDPVKVFGVIQDFKIGFDTFILSAKTIGDSISATGITFKSTESAYTFLNLYETLQADSVQ